MPVPGEDAVRGFADAITRSDLDAALQICHPDVEFLSVLAVGGQRYLGHDGIRQYFEDVASAWAEWSVDVERVIPGSDDRVGIFMTMRARGKESGAVWAEETAHIWTLRDGRLLRNEPYRRQEDALRELDA
jgi:ketosteroid isomerase-like protein